MDPYATEWERMYKTIFDIQDGKKAKMPKVSLQMLLNNTSGQKELISLETLAELFQVAAMDYFGQS